MRRIQQARGSFHDLLGKYAYNPTKNNPNLKVINKIDDDITIFKPKKSDDLVRFVNCLKQRFDILDLAPYGAGFIPIYRDGSVYVNMASGLVPMILANKKTIGFLIRTPYPNRLNPSLPRPVPTNTTAATATTSASIVNDDDNNNSKTTSPPPPTSRPESNIALENEIVSKEPVD